MKVICLLIFLGLPLTSTAQTASPAAAPDLMILAYKLGRMVRIDTSRSNDFPQLERQSSIATEINPPRYESQVKAQLKLQNKGARNIESVDCEFLLSAKTATTNNVAALTMHIKKTIRPGATVRVSRWIKGYDLRTWSKLQKQNLLSVETNITRIEYADSSIWKRGSLKLQPRS